MNRGDRQRLLHIQSYCRDIACFIERFGKDYDIFIQDKAYSSAVSMCILQIGELANGLSSEFREQAALHQAGRLFLVMPQTHPNSVLSAAS